MKIVALDIGDVWTGSAISDAMGILARPYKTVKTLELEAFLREIIVKEGVGTVVVGNPITMKGKVSEQTRSVQDYFKILKERFTQVSWLLWDERLSSKRAQELKPGRHGKEEKMHEHSLAAAFILTTYLEYLQFSKS